MIWPKEVTLVSRTQPSGPLCLWQCLNLKIVSRDVLIEVSDSNTYRVKLDILGSPFHPINSTTAYIQKVLKWKRSAKKADQFKYTCRKKRRRKTLLLGGSMRGQKSKNKCHCYCHFHCHCHSRGGKYNTKMISLLVKNDNDIGKGYQTKDREEHF